jgi:hypothetical protein
MTEREGGPEDKLVRITIAKEKLNAVQERLSSLISQLDSKGVNSGFIDNVVRNLLHPASLVLDRDPEKITVEKLEAYGIEDRLATAQDYLYVLSNNEPALSEETSLDFESWKDRKQGEMDHAKEVIAKYNK